MGGWCLKTQKFVVVLATVAVASCVVLDLVSHGDAYFRLGTHRLGPGSGEWLVEAPEVHDLRAADLAVAAARHQRELTNRDCLVVAKDGVIVHESYHNGADANSLHFVDGAGKTATALLVGALVKSAGLDLDKPLKKYGVEAPELAGQMYDVEWDATAWSKVSTRHLLSRVTGAPVTTPGADAIPGASFDTSEATQRRVLDQIIPELIEKLTGVEATRWAREHLGAPLGAPALFERRVKDAEFGDERVKLAAAGGQMATCRAAARVGQLIANRGEWLRADGVVEQLVDGWFVDQMLAPAFPKANAQYGFLAWTHPGAEPKLGKKHTQDWSAYTEDDTAVIRRRCDWPGAEAKWDTRTVDLEAGDGAVLGADGPEYPLAIAAGELGKFVIASPHANLVVVSMGNTWGADARCPVEIRTTDPPAPEDLFLDAHVDPKSVHVPVDPFASYKREDDHAMQEVAIEAIVADAARDAAAGLSLAPRKPQPKLGSKIPANSPKDPYASGVFSGTVDEVATLRTLWKILNAAVTPEAHPWTTGDRRTMWQTMRGGVGAGGAMHRATKEKEATGAARKAAAARIVAEEAAAAASASASASASAGLGRARTPTKSHKAKSHKIARGGTHGSKTRVKDAVGSLGTRAESSTESGHHGSCRCSCPPASALGQCVDMRGVSAKSCDYDEISSGADGFCPSMGILAALGDKADRAGRLGGFNCMPAADGLASFLCEPVNFGSCAWSDSPCGAESVYAATRSATSSLGGGLSGADLGADLGADEKLTLTAPSAASYVDLRDGAGDVAPDLGHDESGAVGVGGGVGSGGDANNPSGLIYQTRTTVVGVAMLGVGMLLMTTRVARQHLMDAAMYLSPSVSPTLLGVGIDPTTPLTPAEKAGARYYGGLD